MNYKKPTALPAPAYVDALMNWVQSILDDEATFPSKIGRFFLSCLLGQDSQSDRFLCMSLELPGVPFPKSFRSICQTILRRLFRVYGHIYASHFDQICALGIEGMLSVNHHVLCSMLAERSLFDIAHLNTNYRHFLLFVTEVRVICLSTEFQTDVF